MKTPHKHAELIKQWADGAEIEKQATTCEWFKDKSPIWLEDAYYRIKPESKPDFINYCQAQGCEKERYAWVNELSECKYPRDNLKLTFNGETGKLIKAEVI